MANQSKTIEKITKIVVKYISLRRHSETVVAEDLIHVDKDMASFSTLNDCDKASGYGKNTDEQAKEIEIESSNEKHAQKLLVIDLRFYIESNVNCNSNIG